MKPTQTALLLVALVVLVFAVTFASMYIQRTPTNPRPKKEDTAPALSLTFARTRYPEPRNPQKDRPEDAEQPLVSEFGQGAHFDFWFTNDNDEEVRVGLNEKNCTCSNVKLFIAADGWRKQLAATAGQRHGLMSHIVLPAVVTAGADAGAFHELRMSQPPQKGEGVVVPARAAGLVRLSWEGRRGTAAVQGQPLNAELWTQTPGTVGVRLLIAALLVDPIHVDTTSVSVNEMGPGDAKTATVHCWSSSRPHFDVEIRSVTDNPLVVCHKEPLTEADALELARAERQRARVKREPPRPVLSGWRIAVTVHESSKDGKRRLDEGPFTHTLILAPVGIRTEHREVAVHGVVRGDVIVEGGGVVKLEPFAARVGTSRQVVLTSEGPDLSLKLDDSHPPPSFLKVKLAKEGAGSWRLTLEIGPNAVSGSFPRAGRDSAIYLKIEGKDGRRMRIPVTGTALQ